MNASDTGDPDHQPAPDTDLTDTATDDDLREFATRIRTARLRGRLTQRDVAHATGVSLRTISRMEKGLRTSVLNRRSLEDFFKPRNVVDETDMSVGETYLEDVPSIALLAELARRVGVTEHRSGGAWPGPPVRVRWRTADAPSPSQEGDPQRRQRGHTEQA